MKRIALVICVIVLLFNFASCKTKSKDIKIDSSASLAAQNMGEGENTFVFVAEDANGKQTVFNISTNKKNVGDALKEHKLISGDEGEFGLYVKTVNSITYDYEKDGKYWAFYIDGEYATSGIDKTEIKNGSTYMLKAE